MNSTTIAIAIKDGENLKRLPTNNDSRGEKYFAATINARALMSQGSILDEWKLVNPRDIDPNSLACRSMEESLTETPAEFVYLNKGLLILARSLEFDQKDKSIKITLTDPGIHGLVDGGHTFYALKKFVSENPKESNIYVRIDFIIGIEERDRVTDITTARNTSAQVKDVSIMDMEGKFDDIKRVMKEYKNIISYKENEGKEIENPKPISVRDIIAYMMCFNIEAYPIDEKEKQPITVYSGKATTLKLFDGKANALSAKYAGILPVIVQLRDEIYKEFPTISPKLKKLVNNSGGAEKPIIMEKNTELYFIRDNVNHRIFDGLYLPILAAFRSLIVENNGLADFSEDPIELFRKIKEKFSSSILIGLEECNNNPQTFGKRKSVWVSCLETVKDNKK